MHPPSGSGRFGATLGMTLLAEREDGAVEVALDAGDAHLRDGGIVHGGVLFSALDSAMAAAVRRKVGEGAWIASVSITVDFLAGAKEGRLVARGWVERQGRTVAFPRGELRGENGMVVARASGIWAIRSGTEDRGAPAAR